MKNFREKLTVDSNNTNKKETNTIRRKKFQESVREKEHKVYRNWANWILMKGKKNVKIESFETDFVDGIKLIQFTEALTSLEFKYDSNPKHDFARIANINVALDFFRGAKVQLSAQAEDFLKGNLGNILGFFWILIQRFQIIRGGKEPMKKMTKEEVFQWIENYISEYDGSSEYRPMDISKLKDGNVLAWMVHQTDPTAINLDELKDMTVQERLDKALDAARDVLGVPQLITSDVLMEDDPHELSVLAYLYTFKAIAEEYRNKRLQQEEEYNKKFREIEEQRRQEEEKRRKEEEERRREEEERRRREEEQRRLEEEKRLEEERKRRQEEERRRREEEERRREEEERRRLEELKRLEEERKRIEEERRQLEEKRRLEEERRRLEEERRRLEEQKRQEEERRLEEERQRQLEEDRKRRLLEKQRQEEIKRQQEEEEERQRKLLEEQERKRREEERRRLELKRQEEEKKKQEELRRRQLEEEQNRMRKLREEEEERKRLERERIDRENKDNQLLKDAVQRAREREARLRQLLKDKEKDNYETMKNGALVDYNGIGAIGTIDAHGKYLKEACEICEKMLEGTIVIVNDDMNEEHMYHQHCFVCKKCSKKFTDYYWRYKGSIYCQPHYLEAADMKCNKCRDWIKDPTVVMSFDKKWHEDHFCCESSGKKFSDQDPYYMFNGKFLCKEEYYKQSKHNCHVSNKNIEDEVIVVKDRFYSNQYFICGRCQKNLRHESFHTVDGDPMCNKCVEEKNYHRVMKNKY